MYWQVVEQLRSGCFRICKANRTQVGLNQLACSKLVAVVFLKKWNRTYSVEFVRQQIWAHIDKMGHFDVRSKHGDIKSPCVASGF
jgi:hypothetical protein